MNYSQAECKPVKNPRIPNQLEELNKLCVELDEAISGLSQQLQSVSEQEIEYPTPSLSNVRDNPVLTKVALPMMCDQLNELKRKMTDSVSRIRGIRNRLEV